MNIRSRTLNINETLTINTATLDSLIINMEGNAIYKKNKTGPRSRVEVRARHETLTLTAAKTTIIFKTQKKYERKDYNPPNNSTILFALLLYGNSVIQQK